MINIRKEICAVFNFQIVLQVLRLCLTIVYLLVGRQEISAQISALNRERISIVVWPQTSFSDNPIEKLKQNPITSSVVETLNRRLEEKNYQVKDLREMLNISEIKGQSESGSSFDYFKVLAQNAFTDVVLVTDIRIDTSGMDKELFLSIAALDKYTAQRYVSTGQLKSTKRRWPDIGAAVTEVLSKKNVLDTFLIRLDEKLSDIEQTGRLIDIQIESKHPGLLFNMKGVTNPEISFAEQILDWTKLHAKNQLVSPVAISSSYMRMEVRIPSGFGLNNSSPTEWGLNFSSYIQSVVVPLKINPDRVDMQVWGTTLSIIIQ